MSKMTALVISLKPEELKRVLNGEQSVLIFNSFPKSIPTPFIAYLQCKARGGYLVDFGNEYFYQTPERFGFDTNKDILRMGKALNGKVAAKCIIEKIDTVNYVGRAFMINNDEAYTNETARKSHAVYTDLVELSKGKDLYAYHITQVNLFNNLKELREFYKVGLNEAMSYWEWVRSDGTEEAKHIPCPRDGFCLRKTPKNWCLVESEEA